METIIGKTHLEFIQYANQYPNVVYRWDSEKEIGYILKKF